MSEKRNRKLTELAAAIAGHQARIEQLGSKWGAVLTEKLDLSEREALAAVRSYMRGYGDGLRSIRSLRALESLEKKLRKIRGAAYDAGLHSVLEEGFALADNEQKWAKRLTREILGAGNGNAGMFHPDLFDRKGLKEILDDSIIGGRNVREWFRRSAENDLNRVMDTVRTGLVNGLTIPELVRSIRGSEEKNYTDGVFETSRRQAATMARTICSGLANQAKDRFYRKNGDVVIGVEWLDTLDGRTCAGCAGLSRKRWKTEESHPIPPLHHNCRCVLIPVTELTDFGEDANRPMANADFNAEAKRMYESRYPGKRYEDLAPSTRKKYYYDAMREFEDRTGKPAYSRAPGQMSFREYFERMTEEQKRDWLGKTKYELWKTGKYPVEDFIAPYPRRALTVKELKGKDLDGFRR